MPLPVIFISAIQWKDHLRHRCGKMEKVMRYVPPAGINS
jgi:hypothetical protein